MRLYGLIGTSAGSPGVADAQAGERQRRVKEYHGGSAAERVFPVHTIRDAGEVPPAADRVARKHEGSFTSQLHVGNLDFKTTGQELEALSCNDDPVQGVAGMTDCETGRSRGFSLGRSSDWTAGDFY